VVDFAVLLSINLGLINLFPGASDGGRLPSGAEPCATVAGPRAEEGFAPLARSGIEFDAVRHLNDLVSLNVNQHLKHIFA
jgi:hypothetical protein